MSVAVVRPVPVSIPARVTVGLQAPSRSERAPTLTPGPPDWQRENSNHR